jgi:hypothetical protein
VATESSACPQCGQPLYPEERLDISGGRWFAEPGSFVQKFAIANVQRCVRKGLIVEAGTRAVFLHGGQVKGWLDSGEHTFDGIARRIGDLRKNPPREAVLLHSGEVALPFQVSDLYAHEEDKVQLRCEIVLRAKEDASAARCIIENVLGRKKRVTYNDLAELLRQEVKFVASRYVPGKSIFDLFADPDVRDELESEMKAGLGGTLGRCGLEFVQLASVDFESESFEQLRKPWAELERRRREVEFLKALSKVEMEKFKTLKDWQEYVGQLAHEHMLLEIERETEERDKLNSYMEWLVVGPGPKGERRAGLELLEAEIRSKRAELEVAKAEAAEEIVSACEDVRPRGKAAWAPLKIEECDDTPDSIAATLSVARKGEDTYRYHLFHKPVLSFGRKWFEGEEPVNEVVIRNYVVDETGKIVEPDPSWAESRKKEFKRKMDRANLMVSRRHFCLEEKEGRLFAHDRSTYGTTIDGRPMTKAGPYLLTRASQGTVRIVCGGQLCLQAEVKSRRDEPKLSWRCLSWARRGTRYRCVRIWQPDYSAPQAYFIIGTQILIGSASDCDIRLEGGGVAELHSRVFRAYGELWLESLAEELSSTVDGKKLPGHEPVRLEHGMEIGVGDYSLCFDQYRPIIVDYDSVSG